MTDPVDPDEQGKTIDDHEIAEDANLARKAHEGDPPPDEGDAEAAGS